MEVEVTFGADSYGAFQHWIQSQPGNWTQDFNFENIVFTSEQYPKYAYLVLSQKLLNNFIKSNHSPKVLGVRYFSTLPNTAKNQKRAIKMMCDDSTAQKLDLNMYVVVAIELPSGVYVKGLDSVITQIKRHPRWPLNKHSLEQFFSQWETCPVDLATFKKNLTRDFPKVDRVRDAFIDKDGHLSFITVTSLDH